MGKSSEKLRWFKENASNIKAACAMCGGFGILVGSVVYLSISTYNQNREHMAVAMTTGLKTFSGDHGQSTYAITQITKSGDCEVGTAYGVSKMNGDGTPTALDPTSSLTLRVCGGKPTTLAAN